MEVITYMLFGTVLLLLILWKYWFVPRTKNVEGGYKHDIILPFTDPVELYFADISSMSMKVRMCLAEAGIAFKPHLKVLPTLGSYETKTTEYLRINPAGTVPVLVHYGHPIHESSEQLKYIANKLVSSDGPKLIPSNPDAMTENEYWVEQTSMYLSEIVGGFERALKRRPGNCVPFITLASGPIVAQTLSLKNILNGIFICGFNLKQIIPAVFWMFGVHTFKIFPKLANLVKGAKKELFLHLAELDEFLKGKGTKFISGSEITLADISWAPILERMDLVGLWEHVDPVRYSNVIRYWQDMRMLPSYKEATRLIGLDGNFLLNMKFKIKEIKEKYPWQKDLYD